MDAQPATWTTHLRFRISATECEVTPSLATFLSSSASPRAWSLEPGAWTQQRPDHALAVSEESADAAWHVLYICGWYLFLTAGICLLDVHEDLCFTFSVTIAQSSLPSSHPSLLGE